MSIQCKTCQPTTAVDLKVTVSAPNKTKVSAAPKADFLIITWTAAEAQAMALVFGKGQYKFNGEHDNNFTPLLFGDLTQPAEAADHAYFFHATINGKTVACMKSEFHPKIQPSETTLFFERLAGTSLNRNVGTLITSGTSGGIWDKLDLGDVVVTSAARFGMTMTKEQQALKFKGITNVVGGHAPTGYGNWYDYANAEILKKDQCLNNGLISAGGRKAASGSPSIYYKSAESSLTDVVTNSRISDDECGRIANYRILGATLDENDAYVASALKAVAFTNWVSIRNVSDLPCAASSDDQYDRFGYCSSICGAYAIWAFIMSH